jgi:stalled ribosome rescue protein Dom34
MHGLSKDNVDRLREATKERKDKVVEIASVSFRTCRLGILSSTLVSTMPKPTTTTIVKGKKTNPCVLVVVNILAPFEPIT